MEDYIKTEFLKSTYPLSSVDFKKFNVLLDEENNIEAFRVTTEGIYLEYNKIIGFLNNRLKNFLPKMDLLL
ncbi:MAG: hypothetical protein KAS71_11300 [Bacteroidales bacterium]|nr:hypothetical protein [Bacteroidales bacterium]